MATLDTELEKAQKTLAEARNLDTSGEGEESDEDAMIRKMLELAITEPDNYNSKACPRDS